MEWNGQAELKDVGKNRTRRWSSSRGGIVERSRGDTDDLLPD
jgi:hypothetical protein